MNSELSSAAVVSSGESALADGPFAYREFRAQVLAQCRDELRRRYRPEPMHPISALRRKILALRDYLSYYGTEKFGDQRIARAHFARALGFEPGWSFSLSRRQVWLRRLMRCLPDHVVLRMVRPWLAKSRSYEGRAFIYRHYVPRKWLGSRIDYDRAIDYGVMHWGGFASHDVMKEFACTPLTWIRAARRLGLDSAEAMVAWAPRPRHKDVGELLWLLVRLGAITTPAEARWVARWFDTSLSHLRGPLDEPRIGEVVRILLHQGVSRESVVRAVCTLPHHRLDSAGFTRSLTLLRSRGICDFSTLLDALGVHLGTATVSRWHFLLDVIGAADATAIVLFKPLLVTSEPFSEPLAKALLDRGATRADLVPCQQLLFDAAKVQVDCDPVAALNVLTGAPYQLPLQLVSEAKAYVCKAGDLTAFLSTLAEHGYGDPAVVLQFQPCYRKVPIETMTRLLALVQTLKTVAPVEDVVQWVLDSGSTGYIDAFEYLARHVRLRTLPQLCHVAQLGFLGLGILRFLVEEKGLNTKDALMKWFHGRAYGIKSVRWSGTQLRSTDRVLFEDGFARGAFNYFDSNRTSIRVAVDARVVSRLGPFPYRGSEAEQKWYHAKAEPLAAREHDALPPLLPRMLHETSGILFATTVTSAWDGAEALTEQLARLAPLLGDLLEGRGPTESSLSEMEVDAIALIYRSAPDTVRATWHHVVGHESDLVPWRVAPSYQMTWRTAMRTLRHPLDRTGAGVVGSAARFAMAFHDRCKTDSERACQDVVLQLEGDAAQPKLLVVHLGVLMAVAAEDRAVCAWLRELPGLAAVFDENAYEQVLRLHTFFDIGIPDALQAYSDAFRRALPLASAQLLAKALGESSGQLYQALTNTAQLVQREFGAWATQELAKFATDDRSDDGVTMHAVVTKHPAAFFAKETARLCTSENVAMWQETRHAHMVVYDRGRQSVQGMALLYREVLPSVHATRPVLIIRAINPTSGALDTYHVSSIVSAFLNTAVQIARDAGCVAVAFPPNTVSHLLSNLDPIDKEISAHWLDGRRSTRLPLALSGEEEWFRPAAQMDVTFDAYERGEHPVNSLHLLWRAPL